MRHRNRLPRLLAGTILALAAHAAEAQELGSRPPFALFAGLQTGGSYLFPGSGEETKYGYHLMLEGFASVARERWIFDAGGGWFYNQLYSDGEKSTRAADGSPLEQRDLKIRSRAGYLSAAGRYVLNAHWRLGPIVRGLLDNSIAFSQDPEGSRPRIFAGVSAVYDFSQPRGLFYRANVDLTTDLTIPKRQIVFLSVGVHVGTGFRPKQTPEPKPAPEPVPPQEPPPPAPQRVRVVLDGQMVNFGTAKWELEPRLENFVRELGAYLSEKESGWDSLSVEGHTDTRGKLEYNMDLSAKRAATIKRLLVEAGVPNGRVTTQGYGPTQPIVSPEKTQVDFFRNRRVVFSFEEVADPEGLQKKVEELRKKYGLAQGVPLAP